MAEDKLTNNGNDDHLWAPLRPDDISLEIKKLVSAVIEKTPEMPLSVQKIIEKASNSETDLEELVELISLDPVLVSSILKVVNSSYYGLSHKTDNLHLAVVLLGFKEVKSIAMKSHFARSLGAGRVYSGYDTRQLWEHSYLVSVCAEEFIDEEDAQRRGVFLTLGLLHDIGKFALYHIAFQLKKKGIIHKRLEKNKQEPKYILEKEEHLFSVNHNIVGGMLASKWNLSKRLISVLECHHYPSFFDIIKIPAEYSDFEEEISVICISDLIARKFSEKSFNLPEPHPHFFEILGYEPPLENIFTPELQEKLEKAREFLKVLR